MTHPSLTDIPALAGRYDIYGGIHKGLRRTQCDLLARLGSADFSNRDAASALLADLRALLVLAASHVQHEDLFIHKALRDRAPDATRTVDSQHADHRIAFAQLEKLIAGVEAAPQEAKAEAGRALYLAFAAYVADDLEHMHEEETVTAPLLWSLFSDAELLAIEMNIIGSLTPEKNMAFMRIMIPAMNPDQRAGLLGAMKAGAPAEAFNAVIEFAARPNLADADFADLARRLDLAA